MMSEQELYELLKKLREAKQKREEKFSDAINQLVHTYESSLRKEFFDLLNQVSTIKRELDSEYDIEKTDLYDYRVNLIDVDYFNISGWEPNGIKTDFKSVVCGFLTDQETHLTKIRKQVVDRGYFNINDSIIKNFQKPSYIIELSKAEKISKLLGLIKNNKSTELNHLINKYRDSRLDEGFNYNDLINFIKNLIDMKFEESIENESTMFFKNNPKIIESLRTNLATIEF